MPPTDVIDALIAAVAAILVGGLALAGVVITVKSAKKASTPGPTAAEVWPLWEAWVTEQVVEPLRREIAVERAERMRDAARHADELAHWKQIARALGRWGTVLLELVRRLDPHADVPPAPDELALVRALDDDD